MHSKQNKTTFILQVTAGVTHGGAARIANTINDALLKNNFVSKIATGGIIPAGKSYLRIPKKTFLYPKNMWEKLVFPLGRATKKYIGRVQGAGFATNALHNIARPSSLIKTIRGVENFENYPGTADFFNTLTPFPDIVHGHNLHGGYFDLGILPALSHKTNVVLTLHDEWMFTGHCACTFGCTRWKIGLKCRDTNPPVAGCGSCPALDSYPALRRDTTRYNIKQKHNIYKNSRLHIITPSRWLMNKVQQSILKPAIKSAHVIPNGVDLTMFQPGDHALARQKLDLPKNAHIALFIAFQAKTSSIKDYKTLERAMMLLANANQLSKKLLLLCIGERGETIKKDNIEIRFIDYVHDSQTLVSYYHAADVLIHATKSDNFPTTILEAFACGLPVIGTNVGGIPEQIEEETTGLLYEKENHNDLAHKIVFLLSNPTMHKKIAANVVDLATTKFDATEQIRNYIKVYKTLL